MAFGPPGILTKVFLMNISRVLSSCSISTICSSMHNQCRLSSGSSQTRVLTLFVMAKLIYIHMTIITLYHVAGASPGQSPVLYISASHYAINQWGIDLRDPGISPGSAWLEFPPITSSFCVMLTSHTLDLPGKEQQYQEAKNRHIHLHRELGNFTNSTKNFIRIPPRVKKENPWIHGSSCYGYKT